MQTNSKRWILVNKNTGTPRTAVATRELARARKRTTERIFDGVNGIFVR